MRRCPLCGVEHATCGDPTSGIVAVDAITNRQGAGGYMLQRYRDSRGHIFSLNPEDARRLGYTRLDLTAGPDEDDRVVAAFTRALAAAPPRAARTGMRVPAGVRADSDASGSQDGDDAPPSLDTEGDASTATPST